MKTINFTKSLLTAFIIVSLFSCNSKGNDVIPSDIAIVPTNYFVVPPSPVKVQLVNGYIIDNGLITSSANQPVYHMNTDFVGDSVNFVPLANLFSGKGNRLNLQFNSISDNQIEPGTYSFVPGNDTIPFTFKGGFVYQNYDYSTNTGDSKQIKTGTVVVSLDGQMYDFSYDCFLETGEELTGTYSGPLNYNDNPNINIILGAKRNSK